MTPERLFHELLGLGLNWEVIESRFERERGTVYLEIGERTSLWEATRCPKDGGLVFCYDHTEGMSWRHLSVFQHRCEITCRLPRGKCRQCGHVFRVRPPWEGLSTHFTKEFEAFALLLMREMPVSQAAETVGETDTRLWRMLFRHVDAAYAGADFSQVCCVGVDEMSVRKGHEYISVFADLLAKRDENGLRWSFDPDGCCDIRKVQPLARALAGFDATITGRKGFQSATRAGLPRFELDTADAAGRLKVNPLASWRAEDLAAWFAAHDLPAHPLVAEGYPSIGCSPCTSKVQPGEDPRSGRWRGWDKTECGIHAASPVPGTDGKPGDLPPDYEPAF